MSRPRIYDTLQGPTRSSPPIRFVLEESLDVGITVLVGMGLGVLAVLIVTAIASLLLDRVVVPSAILKLVGGIVGGALGLPRGLANQRRHRGSILWSPSFENAGVLRGFYLSAGGAGSRERQRGTPIERSGR